MSQKKNRIAMVDNQIRPADVTNYKLLRAFLEIPREIFFDIDQASLAYAEAELVVGKNRKSMTPRSFARLAEVTNVKAGDEVLFIGAGSGYEVAVISKLCDSVIALESSAAIGKSAEQKFAEQSVDNAVLVNGKLEAGAEATGPYDVVIFNGAIETVPSQILDQVKDGGRVAYIQSVEGVNAAYVMIKNGDHWAKRFEFNAAAPMLPGFKEKDNFVFA